MVTNYTPGPSVTDLSPSDPFRTPAAAAAELERLTRQLQQNNSALSRRQAERIIRDRHPGLLARTHSPAPQNPPVGVRTPEAVPAGSRAHIERQVDQLARQFAEQHGVTHEKAVAEVLNRHPQLYVAHMAAPRQEPIYTEPEVRTPGRYEAAVLAQVRQAAERYERQGMSPERAFVKAAEAEPQLYAEYTRAREADRLAASVGAKELQAVPAPPRTFAEQPREGFNTRVAQAFAELPDGARRQLARAVGAATAARHPGYTEDQVLEATGERLAKWGLLR